MFLTMNRPERHRYVEFKDGQFVTIHQTKASSRMATQEDKQRFEDLTQGYSESSQPFSFESEAAESPLTLQEEPSTFFEEKLPNQWKQGASLIFFVFLLCMAFIIFQLTHVFFNETQAYLKTDQVPLIHQLDKWLALNGQEPLTPSKHSTELVMTDLTQVLHIHHAINESYETLKAITQDYASTKISAGERNYRLGMVLTEINQLIDYNQSRWQERQNSDSRALYEANDARLTHLTQVVSVLLEAPYRGLSIDQLNEGILNDQPLFEHQIQAFKDILDQYQIPYTEAGGKLQFSFESF